MNTVSIFGRILAYIKAGQLKLMLLELLIVAAGIFLGFQVDKWYEHRQDLEKTDEYIERLLTNINFDIKAMEQGIATTGERVDYTQLLFDSLSDPEIVYDDPVAYIRALEFASYKWGAGSTANDSTYVELLNTGDMALIPPDIRDSLYIYHLSVKDRLDHFITAIAGVQEESQKRFANVYGYGDLELAYAGDSSQDIIEAQNMAAASAADRLRSNPLAIDWLSQLRRIQRAERRQTEIRLALATDLAERLIAYDR
ncbi:MAG: hypothetical protein COA96_14270 [SAR86 cluster bacterium]|uniref:Uncharacterized protein n=1 Tax=SAR86 cluster bacterium TaxID=2030880 RepID=A0A2A5ATQ3_9GAMM|nr:MAG: hypothetical protein COA96_14270 [SAR86 cluster bacterium]